MADQNTKNKIKDFVDHLLGNPNIKNEPPLIAEGLLLNFVAQNSEQLKATFKTPNFFPNLKWEEVLALIITDLYERIVRTELPVINDFIKNADLKFLSKLTQPSAYPNDFHQQKLSAFVDSIFKNKDVRYQFHSAVNIFKYKVLEKYLNEIFKRRDYLYNELVRVQKTYLEADEYVNFLKILLIIRNAAFMKIAIDKSNQDRKGSLKDFMANESSLKKFIKPLQDVIRAQLPNIDEKSIQLAIKSNVIEKQTAVEDSSSRFLYIMTARYQNYKHIEKVDRGAESPDKSWFGIARKTAESQGYDKRMLEALYRIAGDNNW